MAKKRTAWEQVTSGFRIAGSMVVGFGLLLALSVSIVFLTLRNNIESQGAHPVLGGASLLLLSTILFLTTRVWASWLLAILAFCALKSLGFLLLLAFGSPRIDARTALLTILMFFISAFASIRFVGRAAVGAERLGLVSFLVLLIFAVEFQSWLTWVMAIVILVAGQGIHYLMNRGRRSSKSELSPST
jgi:hypothetical protein